jgi:DtxR family manganese transport transcriptional regulator
MTDLPALPNPKEQSQRFARVRAAHATETQEDYLELIGDLIAVNGEARAADLVERFGVTAATVANTLSRLRKAGLIDMQPYRSIFLTDTGKVVAERSKKRHATVVEFLLSLGLPRDVAEMDAEGIEHHLSEATLQVMKAEARKRASAR